MTDGAPRTLDVSPAPVGGPRHGGRAAALVLAGVVVAIGGSVGIARLAPAPADPPRVLIAVPTLAPSLAGTGTPSATRSATTASRADSPPRLSADDLVAGIRDGTLDGRLVFVDGLLRATPVPCQGPGNDPAGCVDLEVPGLGIGVWQGDAAIPWAGEPPSGAWIVTVVRAGGLVYLGSLLPSGGAVAVAELAAGGDPTETGTLHEAAGYLVTNPVHSCPALGPSTTPCPGPPPFLATDQPLTDGVLTTDAGEIVGLTAAAPEIDTAATVTAGTFLVDRLPGTVWSWRVVARYVPERAVRVLVP